MLSPLPRNTDSTWHPPHVQTRANCGSLTYLLVTVEHRYMFYCMLNQARLTVCCCDSSPIFSPSVLRFPSTQCYWAFSRGWRVVRDLVMFAIRVVPVALLCPWRMFLQLNKIHNSYIWPRFRCCPRWLTIGRCTLEVCLSVSVRALGPDVWRSVVPLIWLYLIALHLVGVLEAHGFMVYAEGS